ncbi:MAG: RidA family protein [Balneolales bacterium]
MNSKNIIQTSGAPEAIGPYSQAVVHASTVYCSGQIGLDPVTGALVPGGVEAQAVRVMDNLEAVLAEAGSGFDRVLKCSIFLGDMDDFATVNEIYGRYFVSNPPAREAVAVKTLPKNALVEISCIASL